MLVELRYHDSGDWVELWVDGKLIEADHSLRDETWVKLLRELGAEVVVETNLPDYEF